MEEQNKSQIMFKPGDIVKIRHEELLNVPSNMLVIEKVTNEYGSLVGMKCIWFDKLEVPHEMIISTKDLKLVKAE